MAKEEQGVIIVSRNLSQSKLACIKKTINERNKQIKEKENVLLKDESETSGISRPVKR